MPSFDGSFSLEYGRFAPQHGRQYMMVYRSHILSKETASPVVRIPANDVVSFTDLCPDVVASWLPRLWSAEVNGRKVSKVVKNVVATRLPHLWSSDLATFLPHLLRFHHLAPGDSFLETLRPSLSEAQNLFTLLRQKALLGRQ